MRSPEAESTGFKSDRLGLEPGPFIGSRISAARMKHEAEGIQKLHFIKGL